jgi:hypothetical protein
MTMRNIGSHSIIVTFLTGFAHYTNLGKELAHSLHAEWLVPDWIKEYPLVLTFALAIVCIPIISHAIPIIARFNIGFSKAVLAIHGAISALWLTSCSRFEKWIMEHLKRMLWVVLAKIEDMTAKVKNDDN